MRQMSGRDLETAVDVLETACQRSATIFVCGNGGSAATAAHFACDLAKWTILPDRPRVRAVALTENLALLTAWANDTDYERVFVEQLIGLFRPGDVLVAISASGDSPNVLRAAEWVADRGAQAIGLSGFAGGALAKTVSHAVVVDSDVMPRIEDVHSAICHGLAVALRARISAWPGPVPLVAE
jgi:D-sedoheptulose 7-phosphate isomerase